MSVLAQYSVPPFSGKDQMSARRKLGEYTLIIGWQGRRWTESAPWALGGYRWSLKRTGASTKGFERGFFHVWDTPSKAGYGATPEELGVTRTGLATKTAYDAVALRLIREWHDRWPNRELYQELLAHAYVNALKSGAINQRDLANAPERTQMLVDQLLGVK